MSGLQYPRGQAWPICAVLATEFDDLDECFKQIAAAAHAAAVTSDKLIYITAVGTEGLATQKKHQKTLCACVVMHDVWVTAWEMHQSRKEAMRK